MSNTRKDQQRKDEDITPTISTNTKTATSSSSQVQQQQAVNQALDNNNVFSNLDAFKTSIQNTRDNVKEVSRIGVNAAKLMSKRREELHMNKHQEIQQ